MNMDTRHKAYEQFVKDYPALCINSILPQPIEIAFKAGWEAAKAIEEKQIETYKAGWTGKVALEKDDARCELLHDSPPDQKTVQVKLQEDFCCLETGDTMEVLRVQFTPDNIQPT